MRSPFPSVERCRELLGYNPDSGLFTWKVGRPGTARPGTTAGHISVKGYRVITVDGHLIKAHRLAWAFVHGEFPTTWIDHINMERADNRIANLRLATPSQNKWNERRRINNSSGVKGVHWCNREKKFIATIRINGKGTYLGQYSDIENARKAYVAAALKHRGEFARTE